MKIHEVPLDDGSFEPILLTQDRGEPWISRGKTSWPLPDGALAAVMARYGKPLEPGVKLMDIDVLELAHGIRVRHVRHLDFYDVIARDYLVYETPGEEPSCAMATTVAGALEHLARAAYGR